MVNSSSILRTLIYSDVFDYPLTKKEIWKFLINKGVVIWEEFEKKLKDSLGVKLVRPGGGEDVRYCLLGREKILELRERRKRESRRKLKLAKKIIKKLSIIPTVLFIGISGGLALENSEKDDDIDLFIITSKGNLWTTRLILVLLLKILGRYRGRGNQSVGGESNKICLNMFLDEKGLIFGKNRQNLYTAHEIVQLKPMFDKGNTYGKFLNANRWVLKILPNAIHRSKRHKSRIMKGRKSLLIVNYSLLILEKIAKLIQLWYMKKYRTIETISDHMLAFHPFDYKNFVLKEYNKRLRKYKV